MAAGKSVAGGVLTIGGVGSGLVLGVSSQAVGIGGVMVGK